MSAAHTSTQPHPAPTADRATAAPRRGGLKITLKVWRQSARGAPGAFETHELDSVSPDMSFLEMLDVVNERLVLEGKEPIAFEHDCREGICGSCGFMVNGRAHGPDEETTVCQLHMRRFRSGETLVVEPWRSRAFPVLKDLVCDRSSFDRIIAAGGYVSVNTGSAPEANTIPVPKDDAESAFDAAACIACGACVAACPNGSAMLFVAAKVAHLGRLPQGQPERDRRALDMVAAMDAEGFGACSNHLECEAACPKAISGANIARLNRDWAMAALRSRG
jgi:succinate dehydrogenase / fumarate reductase, iron-sulfur subunit